jgi:hypothetical protein
VEGTNGPDPLVKESEIIEKYLGKHTPLCKIIWN